MVNTLLGLAVLVLLIVRQTVPRRVKEDGSLRPALILGGIGLVQTIGAVRAAGSVPAAAVGLLVLSLAVGAGFGVWRATTVRLWRDSAGALWRRGTTWTATLWIVGMAVHLAGDVVIDRMAGAPHHLAGATVMLYLGVSLGVQAEAIRARATRRKLVPVRR